jgi:hypothetical protein
MTGGGVGWGGGMMRVSRVRIQVAPLEGGPSR